MTPTWDPSNGRLVRPRTDAERERARRLVARGRIVPIVPGVYAPAAAEPSLALKIAAVRWIDPAAVVTRHAAAKVWWPQLEVPVLTVRRSTHAAPLAGFAWERRALPAELITHHGEVQIAAPALTVVDLIPELGGAVIDEALRRGAVTVEGLRRALALTPGRRGNALRRELIEDSRDRPWSEAERGLHRILRAAPLGRPFLTNHPVALTAGGIALLDVAIPPLLLGIEVDGYAFHGDRTAFEHDRARDSDLAAQGWWVLRFSAAFVERQPGEVRRRILAAVALREAQARWAQPPRT